MSVMGGRAQVSMRNVRRRSVVVVTNNPPPVIRPVPEPSLRTNGCLGGWELANGWWWCSSNDADLDRRRVKRWECRRLYEDVPKLS